MKETFLLPRFLAMFMNVLKAPCIFIFSVILFRIILKFSTLLFTHFSYFVCLSLDGDG